MLLLATQAGKSLAETATAAVRACVSATWPFTACCRVAALPDNALTSCGLPHFSKKLFKQMFGKGFSDGFSLGVDLEFFVDTFDVKLDGVDVLFEFFGGGVVIMAGDEQF